MIGFHRLLVELEQTPQDQLEAFDWVGPFGALQQIWRPLSGLFHHHGSESWADYYGLSPHHNNDVKQQRRMRDQERAGWMRDGGGTTIARWFLARGLGSPPD